MKKQASVILIVAVVSMGVGAYIQRRHDQQSTSKTVATDKSHTTTTVKIIKHKDGTEETTKIIVSDRDKKSTKSVKSTLQSPKLNVSLLVANDFGGSPKPLYGVSFSKEFIGPITLGAFGLLDEHIIGGVSIGINF